jgi:transcription termination/antitermination protein NusG
MMIMIESDRPFAEEGPAWYAVHIRHLHEAKVESDLRAQGLEVFVPRITVRSRRRDKVKLLEIPLFSCYVFVYTKMNKQAFNAIVRHKGVLEIVRANGKGCCISVPAETLASIRSMVESGKAVYPCPGPVKGRQVKVVAGPLTGVTGTLRRKSGKRLLAVGVEPIGQSMAVELEDEVDLVSPNRKPNKKLNTEAPCPVKA